MRIFAWEDPNELGARPESEYPIEVPNEGRIVGEIHIDHVRVNYQKNAFEYNTIEWKQVVRTLRGDGPLRPNIARDAGYPPNESPIGRLFTGYRRLDPGLKYLVPGDGDHAIHEKAREWAKLFRKGDPEYQDDHIWYEQGKQQVECCATSPPPTVPSGSTNWSGSPIPPKPRASLVLRAGDRSALGFYLDNDRVHVGDVASCLDDVFETWSRERAGGRDCLVLAPTRELVRELSLRAQASRDVAGASVGLADSCLARRSDVVISRRNDRRLGVSRTDWVKNGDRWIVTDVRTDGALSVRHATSRLHATLPAEYVSQHVELGYASTVHTAQGITTDVVHGIVNGTEDRQMLYTMVTRGRVENHAHIVLDTDSSHAVPSPTVERAMTATEVLEGILARDGAAVSASTAQATGASPEAQLHDAVTRYADAVAFGSSKLRAEPEDAGPGPLPWLPGIPIGVGDHPSWGPYLSARSRRVNTLATEVARREALPRWTMRYDDVLTADVRRELAVWRAATGVPAHKRSLVGPPPHDDDEAAYHRSLTNRINARYGEALHVWQERIVAYIGHRDEQTGQLAKYLDGLKRKGVDAERMLDLAVARKPGGPPNCRPRLSREGPRRTASSACGSSR